jgi:lipopolysaccharide/colanic/teichoic acid biosynthesis glycosyltransferase
MVNIITYSHLKRIIDFAIAYILWILASPFMVIIFFVVKLTSPGPGFYEWKVVGEKGKYFTGFKFRSMYQNADAIKANLLNCNEMTGPVFKMTDDPRVTPVGRILRKYSLDELPQLWSVLKGDMSLVGPRPPLQSEYEQFTEWQKRKLAVKPGITCLWQTLGRNDVRDFNEWVKLDLAYIKNRSIGLDMKILCDTIKCVMRGTGK